MAKPGDKTPKKPADQFRADGLSGRLIEHINEGLGGQFPEQTKKEAEIALARYGFPTKLHIVDPSTLGVAKDQHTIYEIDDCGHLFSLSIRQRDKTLKFSYVERQEDDPTCKGKELGRTDRPGKGLPGNLGWQMMVELRKARLHDLQQFASHQGLLAWNENPGEPGTHHVNWGLRHQELAKKAHNLRPTDPSKGNNFIFRGDSITEGLEGQLKSYFPNGEVFAVYNNTTQNLLNATQDGESNFNANYRPDGISILIGTNDLDIRERNGASDEEIARDILSIAAYERAQHRDANVMVFGLLPRVKNTKEEKAKQERVKAINVLLEQFVREANDPRLKFADVGPDMLNEPNQSRLWKNDGEHPTKAGNEVLLQKMRAAWHQNFSDMYIGPEPKKPKEKPRPHRK
jgi:lysophospholipase L1-like esterase